MHESYPPNGSGGENGFAPSQSKRSARIAGSTPLPGPHRSGRIHGGPVAYCVGPGPTEIGFTGAGAAGAVNPGITGAVVTTPVAASVMLIPYASSVLDVNCRSAARSLAYAAVAEIKVFSAFARFLC